MDLLCRFCGEKCGEGNFKPEEIADVRCSEHETEYGNYREMELKYLATISPNRDDFKKYMEKCKFKKSKFDSDFSEEKEKFKPSVPAVDDPL